MFVAFLSIVIVSLSGIDTFNFNVRGEKESGSITGVFTNYDYDDSCGDVLWCYTDILVNGTWYYFGSPCSYVKTLPFNETYTFDYIPHKNMDCSGGYFWDTQISKIYDMDGVLLWKK